MRFQIRGPKRRRINVVHLASGGDGVLGGRRLDRRCDNFVLADAGRIHLCLMRKIQPIIYQEEVIALRVVSAPLEDPRRIGTAVQVGSFLFVGKYWVADPHPHEPVSLGDGIYPRVHVLPHDLLPWHPYALPAGIEFQPVILANEMIAHQIPKREGEKPVRASIPKR